MGLFNRKKSPEEKRYEELTGGFLVSDDYIAILEANGLNTIDGEKIRERVKKEIKNGSLTTDDILGRLDYLIKEKSRIKGHNPRGYDLSILHPNITTPVKHIEDLSNKTDDELIDMLPKFCSNCGNETGSVNVFCPNCHAYNWNPISDTLIRRFIKYYFDFGEAVDDEYHANFIIINELKSKGYSIQSIFLNDLCSYLSFLSVADNIITDTEVEFINEYLPINYNKNQIKEIIGKIDKNYKDKLPISFIIVHELDTELQDGNNYLEFTNNFYQTFGALFISCDNKIDPKEKSILMDYCDNLENNVKKLRAGKYELDYNDFNQQDSIKFKDQTEINIGEIITIPKHTELYPNVLNVLSDGKEHSIHEIREIILDELNLTEDERNETTLNSINRIEDRINWAIFYLKKSGLIERKKRGFVNITDLGLKEFNKNPNLTENDLMKYPSFVYAKGGKSEVDSSYNELASEIRELRNDINVVKRMQSNMNDTVNNTNETVHDIKDTAIDTNETVHDIKDTAIDTNETVHDISDKIDQLSIQLNEIHKDYKKDQQETRNKLDNALSDTEIDEIMSKHTDNCIKKIGNCINETFGNYKFKEEEKELCNLLKKENWNKLENESKKFLITSKITYKSLNKLPDDIMDYSGVCLLVTKALEVELTKRFCKWFLDYLKGKDYSEYHSSLLNTNNRTGDKYKIKPKNCTLGTITYILGFGGSDNPNEEYEKNLSISIDYSKNILFKNFSTDDEKIRKTLIKYGSYVDKIRLDYRNPAAHTGLLNQTKAEECFEYVLELQKVLKEMLESFDE